MNSIVPQKDKIKKNEHFKNFVYENIFFESLPKSFNHKNFDSCQNKTKQTGVLFL